MIARIAGALVALSLGGCAMTGGTVVRTDELEQKLVPLFTDAEVAELEALRPQLPNPFRLGIAPPLEVTGVRDLPWATWQQWNDGGARFGTWSEADEARLRAWSERCRDLGWIDDVVFLPNALVAGADGTPDDILLRVRTAAARSHVDAVLVTQTIGAQTGSSNLLALLDLSIVGAFLFPGHDLRSQMVVEGLLVDTRNEYLYASARGTHASEGSSQASLIGERADALLAEARAAAIEEMAQGLIEAGTRAALATPVPARQTAP